nr:hypothetical protein [Lachnospiraceae bacterium]
MNISKRKQNNTINEGGRSKTPFVAHLYSFMVILIIIGFCLGEVLLAPEKKKVSRDEVVYSGEFTQVTDDGGRVDGIVFPANLLKSEDVYVIETILPNPVYEKNSFCFNASHSAVNMYIKDAADFGNNVRGDLVLSYDNSGFVLFGNSNASRLLFLDMKKEMSGKVLRIEVSSKTIYAGRMLECYYADRAEIWEYMVQTRISSVIL